MTLKRNTFETKNQLTSKGFDPNSDIKWTDLPKYSPIEDLVFLQATSLMDLIEVIKVFLARKWFVRQLDSAITCIWKPSGISNPLLPVEVKYLMSITVSVSNCSCETSSITSLEKTDILLTTTGRAGEKLSQVTMITCAWFILLLQGHIHMEDGTQNLHSKEKVN